MQFGIDAAVQPTPFSRRPLSRAIRPFTGRVLEGSSPSPKARGLFAPCRTPGAGLFVGAPLRLPVLGVLATATLEPPAADGEAATPDGRHCI
jgi:hypothetical protein